MEKLIFPINDNLKDFLSDESKLNGEADFISFPKCAEDVTEIIKFALKTKKRVRIQGSLTGITAGAVPEIFSEKEIILNLSKMKHISNILSLSEPKEEKVAYISAEAGATLSELKEKIKGSGYFLPLDPTETSASVGGIVSCNASGSLTYKYGSARNWIKSILAVLPTGEIIHLERGKNIASGKKAHLKTLSGKKVEFDIPILREVSVKSSAGYFAYENMDIIDLFIGMEGTLGVIISTEFYLIPVTPEICGITVFFKENNTGIDFVYDIRKKPEIPIAALEFFDEKSLELFRSMKENAGAFSDIPAPSSDFKSAVYVELHFTNNKEDELDNFISFLEDYNIDFEDTWAAFEEKELVLAKSFRHAFPEAVNMKIAEIKRENPSITKLGTDMSVPDEYLKEIMERYVSDLEKSGLDYVIFGHIGNNHLHVNIIPRNQEEYTKGKEIYKIWAGFAAGIGGSVSAEHGIGKLKRDFLKIMFSSDEIDSMKELKKTLDPDLILNQNNIFEIEKSDYLS